MATPFVTTLLVFLMLPLSLTAQAPSAGDTLNLSEIYALASRNNPMLRAAAAGVRASEAQERSATLPPDPQLRLGVMNASLPGLRTDMPASMAPAIELMQMVPIPGKLGLMGKIARQSTSIREAEARETSWEVRTEAAMAAYEIYSVDRQVAAMRETVVLLKSFEQVARAMYSAGDGRQSDVLRASVELARMEADLVRMQAMRTGAVARLNAVLGRAADAEVGSVVVPEEAMLLPEVRTLVAWAEESRPHLEGGRLSVEQATTRQALARRELWPDLTIGIQYGQRSAGMRTERMGSLMLGVSLPVFARARQLEMREEASAMRTMAEAELANSRARVAARIAELAGAADRSAILIALFRTDILPQARANAASALSAYRVGSVDFMTLIDAQMMVNEYEQELHTLVADFGLAVAELEMTIGRPLDLAPESEETR